MVSKHPCFYFKLVTVLCFLILVSCSTDESDLQRDAGSNDTAYFMVTHGNTSTSDFWRGVYLGTREVADELNVGLVTLHPAISSTGAVLNNLMAQALNGAPPGIIGTVWGEGMELIIQDANNLNIPVAAINVYPDPDLFGADSNASILLYSGQNDFLAGIDVSYGLICATEGVQFNGTDCNGVNVQQIYQNNIEPSNVLVICTISEQTAGVLTRCNAFEQALVSELGLPANNFQRIIWDGSIPESGFTTLTTFFNAAELAAYDLILVMFTSGSSSQIFGGISVPENIMAKMHVGAFDRPEAACSVLAEGKIDFLSDQGSQLQGAKALQYLHFYLQTGSLPPYGQATDGSPDNAWRESPDGYPWYKTGPILIYEQCP